MFIQLEFIECLLGVRSFTNTEYVKVNKTAFILVCGPSEKMDTTKQS